MSLNVITVKLFLYLSKNQFWKIYVVEPNMGDFSSCWFKNLWGVRFHAVVVFGLGENLLFKSVLGHYVVECYCTCFIEILSYFFILQSLTTSKVRKFQTLKLSQFHKAKNCWIENWWSSGIMSNFWGEFFYVLGGKKI